MDITAIGINVPATRLGGAATTATGAPAQVADGFGKTLSEAVQGLSRLQQESDGRALQLAAGEPVELHDVMLAQERASLNMQLAMQVRNKLVEAYQEIMRTQM